MKRNKAYLHSSRLSEHRAIKVLLIGAGGNGALMLSRLFKTHVSLLALGMNGLHVTVCDPDTVSPSNLGRQPFFQSDIGKNKAELLIWRLCASASDLDWKALGRRAEKGDLKDIDIVITCVDTIRARREIGTWLEGLNLSTKYWLDLGNEADLGQVILGEIGRGKQQFRGKLPTVTELVPSIMDPNTQESDAPSCSVAEALEKQDLFVNEQIVVQASTLLWELLSKRFLRYSVVYINVREFSVNAVPIQLDAWNRLGLKYKPGCKSSPFLVEIEA